MYYNLKPKLHVVNNQKEQILQLHLVKLDFCA